MTMKLSQVKEHLLEITKCNEIEFNKNIVKLYFYSTSDTFRTSIIMISNLIYFFDLRFINNDEQLIIEHHIAQEEINVDPVVDCIITIKHDLIFHE